ncbi:hypothetical protein NMY22_g10415 [Coprinellus aureogranulatus]|nr:hypothetical protein NMY22_g10415 [Coprinellus aureogranulatus]
MAIPVTIYNTLGVMQIGTLVAMFLFGIVSLQAQYYLETFGHDDRKLFRGMAAAVWVLELFHTICIGGELYRGTIVFYGNMLGYQNYPFMGAATLLGGFITMIVHIFFCLRVWKALPNPLRYIGAVCGLLTCVRAIGAVYLGSRLMLAKTVREYQELNGWIISAILATGAAIDVVIALSMVHFLMSRRQTGLGHVAKLVDRLVGYAIRTGVLTSIAALTVLITFQAIGETFVWVGFYVVLAKLYSNSFFSALNERERLRNAIASAHAPVPDKGPRDEVVSATEGRVAVLPPAQKVTSRLEIGLESAPKAAPTTQTDGERATMRSFWSKNDYQRGRITTGGEIGGELRWRLVRFMRGEERVWEGDSGVGHGGDRYRTLEGASTSTVLLRAVDSTTTTSHDLSRG